MPATGGTNTAAMVRDKSQHSSSSLDMSKSFSQLKNWNLDLNSAMHLEFLEYYLTRKYICFRK